MPARNGERHERRAGNFRPPPGGAAGAAQQTIATQLTNGFLFAPGFGRSASRPSRAATTARRRKKRRKVSRRAAPRTSRRSKKRAHLVRGSAAAKRYMAKLRRMQKRRR